jgi:nucleoside-diphosphate-sugar epimerase
MEPRQALVLGAASRVGVSMMRALHCAGVRHMVLADNARLHNTLKELAFSFDLPSDIFTLSDFDPERPFAGLSEDALRRLKTGRWSVFHLAHKRNRTLPSAELRRTNALMLERALAIAYSVGELASLVVATDIGLIGDYPGRFSENWIDVGQTPFDEVDRSSLEVELVCAGESRVPIIRVRIGLTLDSPLVIHPFRYWEPPSEELLHATRLLRKLPRFITIPVAVAKGSLAPITPADFAADALAHLAENEHARGKAVHLVISDPPSMDRLIESLSTKVGGARVKGGLPADMVAKLGIVPGFRELARRNADHLASWWTPHRYCLSRNDLDTAHLEELLPSHLRPPRWSDLEQTIQ